MQPLRNKLRKSVAVFFWGISFALEAYYVYDPINASNEAVNTATNSSYRQIFAQIEVTSSGVTLQVAPPTQSSQIASLIAGGNVCNIGVSTATVTQTFAQIISAGSLSVPVTITANPNPIAPTGYQMILQVLPVRININPASVFFFEMQATSLAQSPVVAGTTNILYYDLTYAGTPLKRWLGFPEGAFLSPTWNNVGILSSLTPTSTSSSITFTFTIGSAIFSNLAQGVYWTNFIVAMLPTTSAISTANLVPQEIATFQYLQGNIAGDLQQTTITANTRAILTVNQAFVNAQLALLKAAP